MKPRSVKSLLTNHRQSVLVVGVLVVLCVTGCHRNSPPPLPPGVTPIDSTKPPPSMQQLYQQAHPGGGQPSRTPGH